MGGRAGSGSNDDRHIEDDGHDRAKHDEIANCGRRRLRELSEITLFVWATP